MLGLRTEPIGEKGGVGGIWDKGWDLEEGNDALRWTPDQGLGIGLKGGEEGKADEPGMGQGSRL